MKLFKFRSFITQIQTRNSIAKQLYQFVLQDYLERSNKDCDLTTKIYVSKSQ